MYRKGVPYVLDENTFVWLHRKDLNLDIFKRLVNYLDTVFAGNRDMVDTLKELEKKVDFFEEYEQNQEWERSCEKLSGLKKKNTLNPKASP